MSQLARASVDRRAVVGGSLALAATLTAAVPLAAATHGVDTASTLAQINEVERRCREVNAALDAAMAAYEAALPPPHPDIALENGRAVHVGLGCKPERRLFDGAAPNRGIDERGRPCFRYVATVDTLKVDRAQTPIDDRRRRKAISRMIRRAERREAEVAALEQAFCLEELDLARRAAEADMEELGLTLFAQPAATMAGVQVQARMLCAFETVSQARNKDWLSGQWGVVLARSVHGLGAVPT